MGLIRWIKHRSGRSRLTSSQDVAAELGRARRENAKIADHRPMRTTDLNFDPRNGVPPTP